MGEMKPTERQLNDALAFVERHQASNPNGVILAAAYRSALARAELAEWHERESVAWIEAIGMMPEQWADLQARHERERKELEA